MSGWFLLDNFVAALGIKGAVVPTDSHLSGEQLEADIAYADSVVRNYCKHGAATGRVAEIGPGGSALTGLMLIDRGAERVELLDRFAYAHSQANLDRAYALTIERSERLKALFPRPSELAPRIAFATGEAAAAERYFLEHSGYDSICSCAVFEHLMDPIAALRGAASALNPGGILVHYVDFRDHGMYTAGGAHELTFLKVPGWLYPSMSRERGRPNRVLIDQYRAACDSLGLDYRILATSLVGVGSIEETPVDHIPADLRARASARVLEIRDRLAAPFRDMPVEDLAIDGIALIAHKKPAPEASSER